jgi:hypothetical protein
MMFRNKIRSAGALTVLTMLSIAGNLSARENVSSTGHKSQLKTSATGCQPATQAIDLDINNLRARLMTGGDQWWNIGEGVAAYEIPKGTGKSSQFAASCWIGGYDKQGQLKVAAQTYRQDGNDYWPGALDVNAKITSDVCTAWDNFWKVDKSTINAFIQLSKTGGSTDDAAYDVIFQWPATGNAKAKGNNNASVTMYGNNTYAPFVDINGNGIYEPNLGEYPDIKGDQFIWWVFNDAGNIKQQTATASIGVEVQTSAFAYATQDFLNNASFYNYRVINRGALTIDSTYIAVWDDCDLGYYLDDFIGCDTMKGLGIQYNGTNDDGGQAGHPVNSYGSPPPQVGLDFFQGPRRVVHRTGLSDTFTVLSMTNFTYYNNDFSEIGNPSNGVQIYNYMTGSIRTGQRFSDDFQGAGIPSKGYGSGPVSNFVFWGDPSDNTQWSECACNNNPGDRRFIFSSGPFQLLSGAINDITFGCIWADGVGGCPQTNFKTIKSIDDGAQALFDDHFKTVEGPEAPRLVVRELDRKLVFYIVNDYGSNNYGENYGRTDGVYNDSLGYHQIVVKALGTGTSDTLYKFQGYRIFQLANSSVSTADIFSPTTGEVDPTKAAEVKEFDIHDGVKQIVNYVQNINITGSPSVPQIKVNGQDLGISHSFELTEDQFATNSDKQFINYHSYYFVAIAYAYNNFAPFDPKNFVSTQDQAYIGSSHGEGGTNVPLVVAMPNPVYDSLVGTVLNSAYGDGVIITRLEGVGNGGNDVELDSASEAKAVANGSVDSARYAAAKSPVDIKVVDPVKVPSKKEIDNWTLQINGTSVSPTGLPTTASWVLTAFSKSRPVDTIYSEENIGNVNEQIIEKYGLSINVKQALLPGVDQADGNGYITSDITFDDPSQPWLWGVKDQADSNFANWLRAGNSQIFKNPASDYLKDPCDFNDYTQRDTNSFYQNLLSNFSPTTSTWGPYVLAAAWAAPEHAIGVNATGSQCGFAVAYSKTTQDLAHMELLNDVDLVFTNDKSKWTRCAVVEEQENPGNAQGGAVKFALRKHAGWNGDNSGSGNNEYPTYSESDSDKGMSWFPGYAVDQGTGQRLNIVFGEDSYLGHDFGQDMLWNPSTQVFDSSDGSILFGGKHFVYVLGTKYDSDRSFVTNVKSFTTTGLVQSLKNAYADVRWVGVPTRNPSVPYRSISDGLIPGAPLPGQKYTHARLRFRVTRPYASYYAADSTGLLHVTPGKATNPYYSFTTDGLSPTPIQDTSNRNTLLNNIMAVPNPYYGFSGYESSRLDTRVRITNLPPQVTINIYSLDGSLIRTLSKNDPNTPYIDWDIRNSSGLPIASGMYLMDVKATGIGEVVVKWFGAMRPIDVSTY